MWSQIGQTSCQEKPGRIVLKSQWGWSWFQRVWILKCPLSTSMLPYRQIVPNDNWLMNSLVNFYFSMWAELTEGCPLLVTVVKSGVSGAEAGTRWSWLAGAHTSPDLYSPSPLLPPINNFKGSESWTWGCFEFSFDHTTHQKEDFWKKNLRKEFPVKDVNNPKVGGQLLASSRGETIEWNVRWRGSLNLPRFNTHVL